MTNKTRVKSTNDCFVCVHVSAAYLDWYFITLFRCCTSRTSVKNRSFGLCIHGPFSAPWIRSVLKVWGYSGLAWRLTFFVSNTHRYFWFESAWFGNFSWDSIETHTFWALSGVGLYFNKIWALSGVGLYFKKEAQGFVSLQLNIFGVVSLLGIVSKNDGQKM